MKVGGIKGLVEIYSSGNESVVISFCDQLQWVDVTLSKRLISDLIESLKKIEEGKE